MARPIHAPVSSTKIIGSWGWNAAGPDLRIEVDLFDRNLSLGTVKADLLRQDFLRLGKGKDCLGL